MTPTLVMPRTGLLPSSKTALFTATVPVALKLTLTNTSTSEVKLNIYVRLAAYVDAETGERRISPKDLLLGARYTAVKSGIILDEGDQLLADATAASIVEFVLSGVTQ